MKVEATYDLIIAGGGLSGLSLAYYLAEGGYKGKVLIVDSAFAPINDKTWCFWTKDTPPFKDVIYRTWNKAYFSALDMQTFLYLNEYSYYCIRSGDFKEFVLRRIQSLPNFEILEENVLDFSSNSNKAIMLTKNSVSYLADYIFQSIFDPSKRAPRKAKYPLIQHFLGYEIHTEHDVFDPATFTLMDFDNQFDDGVAFMYVLPFDHNRALLEFTVFSEELLEKGVYEDKIEEYMDSKFGLHHTEYKIERVEYGQIPMHDQEYPPTYGKNIINLGMVAGLTKPSTGYTFLKVQEYTKQLADALIAKQKPILPPKSSFRYRFYDLLLLHILSTSTEDSLAVFKDLFKNNSFDKVFSFLSEKTNFVEDLKIMSSVPSLPFLKAITQNLKLKNKPKNKNRTA
ncbi:lycopene cyclase family protein [Balneola vulgaris]|uniref:lycopene cyclase family protein n=1 Tax=Balneola vulgaris TaxID=287535 RepID=UPI0003724E4F|nr:lycopene cyclase family protein [Balneola vulgaris]